MAARDDILDVIGQIRGELREVREGLDFQMLAAETAADPESHRSVTDALSHVRAVETLLDRLEGALSGADR